MGFQLVGNDLVINDFVGNDLIGSDAIDKFMDKLDHKVMMLDHRIQMHLLLEHKSSVFVGRQIVMLQLDVETNTCMSCIIFKVR